ncbi:hypothetical protein T459_12694 [Capsicum annuum]|uniref:Uncharacterized protein n=1 Tax=Capsicum annuum TaxID=4072 RepID=A0A2G2ZQL9_CAPAN|nr:hypothetical protein T459_12694 [Capsicum annuum]
MTTKIGTDTNGIYLSIKQKNGCGQPKGSKNKKAKINSEGNNRTPGTLIVHDDGGDVDWRRSLEHIYQGPTIRKKVMIWGIDRDFIFLVFELIVISSEPNCPKAMRDDGSQGVMALGIDIHPYAAKVRIYGELIQGKKPHKGFDFVWGISFPDGVEERTMYEIPYGSCPSVGQEAGLGSPYYAIQVRLDSIGKDLGNELVGEIAQTNGSEIFYGVGIEALRD